MASSEDVQFNHMITKFYARCMQVILESRIPAFTSSSSHYGEGTASTSGPGAKGSWFNLVPGKTVPVLEKMEPWCRGVREPMVIDVLLSQPGKNRPVEPLGKKPIQGESNFSARGHPGTGLTASGSEHPIVLERWIVQFLGPSLKSAAKVKTTELQECKGTSGVRGQQQRSTYGYKPMDGASSDHGGRGRAVGKAETTVVIPLQVSELPAVYQRTVILLRSLYCTARLLPAQSLFRLLCVTRRCKFSLSYRILASPPPLPESIKKDMIHHCFTPIESHGGCMYVSVAYQPAVPAAAQETAPLFPQIIADYVGSAATIQLKHFSNERDLHLHSSPPSAQRFPSIESHKLRGQTSNKEMATKDGEGRTAVHPRTMSMKSSDFTVVQYEELECPFAVRESEDNALLLHQCKKTATDALKELKLYIEFRDSLK